MKKISLFLLVTFFFVTCLTGQSLVELSKKEKERRAKLKGKKIVLITSNKTKKSKNRVAMALKESKTSKNDSPSSSSTSTAKNTNTPKKIVPKVKKTKKIIDEEKANFEKVFQRAEERVHYFVLMKRSLQQEYLGMNSTKSRDAIQKEINDNEKSLVAAQKALESLKNKEQKN